MMKSIGSHMVKSPYVGEPDQTLKEALEMMRECNIRHLPITEDDRLIGLVSERDLREGLALPQADQLRVGDVMKTDLLIARRETPLQDIVRSMQEEKLGSAIVVNDKTECIGIFTTIDALGILADMLDREDDGATVLHIEDYVDFWRVPEAVVV